MFQLDPKTKKLLELFQEAEYGDEFSYAQIRQKTGCDLLAGDRQRIYTVQNRLERDFRRTLMNLRGRGYKVANPNEHVSSMRVRAGKARTHMQLAKRTGNATPIELLNDGEMRDLADFQVFASRVEMAFKVQTVWNEEQDRRISQIENRLGLVPQRVVEGDAVEEAA